MPFSTTYGPAWVKPIKITSPVMRRLIAASHADGLRNGHWGRFDDVMAARQPWGFRVQDIRVPVFLACGGDDSFTPPQHFAWLAQNIANVDATFTRKWATWKPLDLVLGYFAKHKSHAMSVS